MDLDALFAPFPTIATARLVLRRLDAADTADAATFVGDPAVGRHTTWLTLVARLGLDGFMTFLERSVATREMAIWGIVPHNQGRVVGFCGLYPIAVEHGRAEIGYALARSHWGRGYAHEAACGVLKHALGGVGFNRVKAYCSADNPASSRVLEKVGMRHEGTLRQHTLIDGRLRDRAVYAALRAEWLRPQGTNPRKTRDRLYGLCVACRPQSQIQLENPLFSDRLLNLLS